MFALTLRNDLTFARTATRHSHGLTTLHSKRQSRLSSPYILILYRHRRTHEAQQDGQPLSASYSEEDLENDENDFGSAGELSSPEEPMHPASMGMSMSVPAPSQLVGMQHHYNQQPPSQMVHPQMLQQHM
jgi:hypothetical protein